MVEPNCAVSERNIKMKQTKFKFFKNTPLIDFQNTIHFSSNAERDSFFLKGNHYPVLNIEHDNFNYIRDKSSVKISVKYEDMQGVNYCTFKSEFEDTRFYAYVMNYEYLNTDIETGYDTVRVDLLIDGIMSFTQGNVLEQLTNLNIQRQHLSMKSYEEHLFELKNNDDILKTNSKSYFKTDSILFKDLIVLIVSSVDLMSDFGSEDNPKIKTSSGRVFDKITSPLNLYACDIEDFQKLMNALSKYPWISQNIKNMSLLPKMFMENNLKIITFSSKDTLKDVDYLYRVSGVNTSKQALSKELRDKSYSMEETYKMFGLDPIQDRHLLRNEYTTTELYNYSGGQLFIDNGQLNELRGLRFIADIVTGYHNEMMVYVDQYRINSENGALLYGSYTNDSLAFNEFDDVPMLIDNVGLAMSKSANQRALTESKLISNRIKNVMDPNADLKDRFFDGASLISNLSPSNLFGKFKDEQEYYKQQKAEIADLALETPTITQQSTGNSFNIANNMFGIHFKFSKPSKSEMNKIKKYYKLFGYELNDHGSKLEKVDSMSICNYVQFEGSWTIKNVDVAIIEMMKAQFEGGVRLWHNKNVANPMNQDILNNKMK